MVSKWLENDGWRVQGENLMTWKRGNSSSTEPCRKMEVGEDEDTLTPATYGSEIPCLKSSHLWRMGMTLWYFYLLVKKKEKFSLPLSAKSSTCSLNLILFCSFWGWSSYSSVFSVSLKIGNSLYMLLPVSILSHSSLSPSLQWHSASDVGPCCPFIMWCHIISVS